MHPSWHNRSKLITTDTLKFEGFHKSNQAFIMMSLHGWWGYKKNIEPNKTWFDLFQFLFFFILLMVKSFVLPSYGWSCIYLSVTLRRRLQFVSNGPSVCLKWTCNCHCHLSKLQNLRGKKKEIVSILKHIEG